MITMALRTRVNLFVIALIGLGMPLYYKIKFLILGMIQWEEIFDPIGLIDVGFGSLLAALVVLGHEGIVKLLKGILGQGKNHLLRLMWQLIATAIFSMGASAAFTIFFWTVIMRTPMSGDYIFDFMMMSLFIPLLVNGITESIYFYGEWERESTVKEKLEKENAVARYEVLKNQISPHFLFNCFNSLAILIDESKDKALIFLKKLSTSYRYILESGEREVISLREEIGALEAYIHLMRVRFGDHFKVNLEFSESEKNQIYLVPMSLQLLFENALKHNVADEANVVEIDFSINNEAIIVSNNITESTDPIDSTRTGLQNLLNRYKTVSKSPVRVNSDQFRHEVRLPIIYKS